MRFVTKALTVSALTLAVMGVPAASAQETSMDAANFVKMCDGDKDGMVSKAEMMKMVEKVWEKADKKKAGKLDKAQVEFFLKELMKGGA
jgi:hypothetical protein